MKTIKLLFFISLFIVSTRAIATIPDISGVYSGTLAGTEDNCGPLPGGPTIAGIMPLQPETISFTINLIDSSTGTFVGSGLSQTGSTIALFGQIDSSGIVSGSTFSAIGTDIITTGNFDGSKFSGNSLAFNASGGDIPVNPLVTVQGCLTVVVSTNLNRIDGGDLVIIPETTNSATLTNAQTLNVQVQAIASDVGGRIGNILRGNAVGFNFNQNNVNLQGQSDGINAGDALPTGFGAWLSYSRSEFENDFVSTAFDGNRNTILTGVDFTPMDNMVLGLALGYEFSDIDTEVNRGNVDSDGVSIIPYFGYLVNDFLSVDLSFGYSFIEADQFRTLPGTSTRVTSTADSERLFGMVNFNGTWFIENWIFGATIGLLWAENYQDDFTESNGTFIDDQDTKLRQIRFGGNLAYSFDQFEPFIGLNYSEDYKQTEIAVATGPQPSNDSDDFLFMTGFRYFNDNGITGSLEYSKRLGRDDFEEDSINATLRMDY